MSNLTSAVACVAVGLGAVLFSGLSHASAVAAVSLSSNIIVVGGGPTEVAGSGLATCAGHSVTASLTFPAADSAGRQQPVSEAARVNSVAAAVDASGSFKADVAMPVEFPGAWLGYVVVEGDCLDVEPHRLLSRVVVSVPLGSETATSLGVSQAAGAVLIIPGDDIRGYPLMPDDPVKDPYAKLQPFVAVTPSGETCGTASGSDRNARGDVIIVLLPKCASEGASLKLKVFERGYLLDSEITVRSGFATGVRLVFPPPGTSGPAETPGPPATGGGALEAEKPLDASAAAWLVAFGSACLLATGALVARRRSR